MALSSFRFPTAIRFGNHALDGLADAAKQAGMQRPLLVTDRGLADQAVCQQTLALLASGGLEATLFKDTGGNPVASHVDAGVAKYRSGQCDGVIMLGGGCAIDVGKAIALMAHHPGALFDYEDDLPGARPFDRQLPPTIAIPTTAGTGSEVGGSTVIADDTTHKKYIIWSPRLIPQLVIADPLLSVSMPPAVTAATGFDALTHNIEAFLAKNYHPICDGVALEGVHLSAQHLLTAVEQPGNLAARGGMLMASMMGAIAFQKGLGVTHSCAHALSTCFDLHHGLANAMMIIPCMEFNAEVVPERLARLGQAVGLQGDEKALVGGFIKWLAELKLKLGLPANLAELGVTLSDRLVDVAVHDACHQNNPRPCQERDFVGLFHKAINPA